ncbi:MAG: DUF4149 domain-containing protein [Flavobacteriales bacterium]|jgi:hypothetical protein
MNLILNFQILISGIIIGIIFFQTALAAPIVFNNLNKSQSRIYIRNIFPKIFKTNMCLSLTLLMVNVIFLTNEISILIGLISFALSLICLLIIPATNNATDNGNTKKFKLLHLASVLMTIIVLIINIIWILFL